MLKSLTVYTSYEILMPGDAGAVFCAVVNIFDSRKEAILYQQGKVSAKNQVGFIDVAKCITIVCTMYYAVEKDSFYFFVLTSKANSKLIIMTDFTFELFQYDSSSLSSGSNVVNISSNVSEFISFHRSRTILLYVYLINNSFHDQVAYLSFSCSNPYKATW